MYNKTTYNSRTLVACVPVLSISVKVFSTTKQYILDFYFCKHIIGLQLQNPIVNNCRKAINRSNY